jgi:cation diffusion facilitator family transporter
MTDESKPILEPIVKSPENAAAGVRATWIGCGTNVSLVVFKLWAGFAANSQALIADGFHSLSDLFSDFVVLLGLKWGRKAEDADHPFGHARIETISSMVIGLTLIVVGVGITYSAIRSIYLHNPSNPGLLAIYAAAISIVLKEILFWYTIRVGRRLRSLAVIGNAWHHRTDAFSSVAVLIGVGATYVKPEWHLADSYAALVVTFFIVKVGINLVWSAFRELSDTAPDREALAQIRERSIRIDGVRQVHDLRARYSGSQIFVEIHIVVDPDMTVRQGHDIARQVKATLLGEFADVTHVIVHVDPELKQDT